MQQGMGDALGGQPQEVAATRQFRESLGPTEGWATGVNTQLQGLNDATSGLEAAITMSSGDITDLQWGNGRRTSRTGRTGRTTDGQE